MEKINWKKHLKVSATVVVLVAGATVVWASGGGHGETVHNAWKDIDTWKVLNFVLLVLGCFFIAKKPVAQFFLPVQKGLKKS